MLARRDGVNGINDIDYDINGNVNSNFTAARSIVIRSDPLVLDLDGDGLELSGAGGNILFDHNADGIKTGTGWARPDDGFLVRDLDGDGTIDTGRELFGIDTLKSNGALATQGFDALQDLDTNNDGFITSADAAYGELKVWQDANQDGISQSDELKTLAELNITSIGVNGSTTGPQAGQLINNNLVALSATYTQDGQAHTVGAIDLETNNFFTEFPPEVVDEAGNPVVISGQAQALPQMNGSGMVRNMQAAASLSSGFADVIAFNVGDGQDTVSPGGGLDDTVSLGGTGLSYANLTLQKNGNDLVLNVSETDKLTFSNWYTSPSNKNVLNLQLVAEAMTAFDAGSSDPLLNKKIQSFDFQGLVDAFDAALAASPGISSWALVNGLTQFHLASSDSAALGGDLAYHYGRDGTLAGIGFNTAQDVVTSAQFGAQSQALQPLGSLQDGVVRLG